MKPLKIVFLFLLVLFLFIPTASFGQAGYDDDRVMLQGFYWESYRHGHERFEEDGYGDKKWYEIVSDAADELKEARFDLIWLPPPSYAGETGAGYDPKEYFNLSNSYGTQQQHRIMLENLLINGVEPIADIVINHRNGTMGWADFTNPDWGTEAVVSSDEAFTLPQSDVFETPLDERGAEEEMPSEYTSHGGTTYSYNAFRDLDHTNPQVREDVIRFLLQLKSFGYRGWRYDMVHGYHARWIATYNRASSPTFSVGEYDWGAHAEQRGWVWHTATTKDDPRTASSVFDFTTKFALQQNKGNYTALFGPFGSGIGMVGDNTDGIPWKNRSVTFLENHDTGYRTNEDGTPQSGHDQDSFFNDWQVEQAYAYILTHPGVPAVYWKHYFDWGPDLQAKIKALINARKVADVHSGVTVYPQLNARDRGVYAAYVAGRKGALYVRIGGSDEQWTPAFSTYSDYREYAAGSGWKVWIGLPGNPEFQEAPLNTELPLPEYREPEEIEVDGSMLN
ncbi:MAG: hypothetical protein KTR29_23765 [Rhodothermaceae bacterium]|nr:hypothetical protein [Rhodothermaceae bacterium]